jgi:hypothetical protein
MRTLVASPFEDDAAEILEWGYGPLAKQIFFENIREGDERVGQAFMNVLRMYDHEEYRRLTGSRHDPFFEDKKLPAAIDRLTSK